MKALAELLKLVQKLYGKKALSKTIGTRTNVITLPDKETKKFITNELNIEAASDAATQKAFKDVEKLIPDIPKMNDQEILTFKNNLQRLDNRINPPSAEVISMGTKQPVSKEGIASLTEQAGQKSPPGTLMGNLESRINQLKSSGKELEDIVKDMRPKDPYAEIRRLIENPTPEEAAIKAKEKARLSKIFDDVMTKGPGSYDWQREGIVRTGAREILEKNLKSGKLKLTDPYEEKMIKEFRQGGVDPIEVFRREYGEGALEQLDDIADELLPAQSYKEINDILNKNKLFDLKPLSKEAKASAKESQEYADKIMKDVKEGKIKTVQQAYEEGELKGTGLDDLLKGFDDEPKVFSADSPKGKEITEALIGKPKAKVTELITAEKIIQDMNKMDPMDAMYEANKVLKKEGKYKNLSGDDVDRIMKETEDHIFERNIPEGPEEFAIGGRVGFNEGSKLSDYLKTYIAASTSSSSPEKGVKIKEEIIDGIVSLNIPLNKKLKLLGNLNFGKNRSKVDLSSLNLGEEVYKGKYFTPELGAEYTTDGGTKFNVMVNPEDKRGSVSVSRSFATGGRVEMASGGITALKALIRFLGQGRGKKGSEMLREINPKRMRHLQYLMKKSDREMLDANRLEYLENLSDTIKEDKKLLDMIKEMPADQQNSFFRMANEGANKGRLDVYRNPDFNIDEAIGEIEQMKKNLKFKDVPEEEVKRQLNADGTMIKDKAYQIWKAMYERNPDVAMLKEDSDLYLQRYKKEKGSTRIEKAGGGVAYLMGL